jgi:hypothetical protein
MKKLHNQHHPAGLEWAILKRLPNALLGAILVPSLMSLLVRIIPSDATATEAAKHILSIDILAIAIFITAVTAIFTVAIGCITVWLMKGPAYVADAYHLEDSEEPEDNKNGQNKPDQ